MSPSLWEISAAVVTELSQNPVIRFVGASVGGAVLKHFVDDALKEKNEDEKHTVAKAEAKEPTQVTNQAIQANTVITGSVINVFYGSDAPKKKRKLSIQPRKRRRKKISRKKS